MEHTKYAGHRYLVNDDKGVITAYCSVDVTLGRPYIKDYGSSGIQVKSPATETTHNKNKVVIALETASSGNIARFQELGEVEQAYVYTCAAGDHLEVLNGGTYLVVDGTSGATTRGIKSCAMALEANAAAAAALKKIVLIDEPTQVAAS